jgi:hypothetical protein
MEYEIEYHLKQGSVLVPYVRSMTSSDGTTLVQTNPDLQMPFRPVTFTGSAPAARPVLPLKKRLLF